VLQNYNFTITVSDNMARPDQRLRWKMQSPNTLHSEGSTNKSLSNEGTLEARISTREGESTHYFLSISTSIVGLHVLHIYAEDNARSTLVVAESPVLVEVTPAKPSFVKQNKGGARQSAFLLQKFITDIVVGHYSTTLNPKPVLVEVTRHSQKSV
jgi:hypothetical protein